MKENKTEKMHVKCQHEKEYKYYSNVLKRDNMKHKETFSFNENYSEI